MENKRNFIRSLALVTVATVLLGEISFYPFGTEFRFGLGSTVYFLGLILFPELLRMEVGVGVGVAVVLFRVGLDVLFRHHFGGVPTSLGNHLPAFGYYIFLTYILKSFNIGRYRDYPLLLGVIVSTFDLLANVFELVLRQGFHWTPEMGTELITTPIVALGKGFVIIGIVSIFSVYRLKIMQEEEKLRLEKTLLLASGLYEETFFLKKSMINIETITAKSFELYQQVKRETSCDQAIAGMALGIAEEVHDLKKDAQRVVAGLSNLVMVKQEEARLGLTEIFSILTRANLDYAGSLGREVKITSEIDHDITISRIYPIISILNNLLSNAIEAMDGGGQIKLTAQTIGLQLKFSVFNDGPPIAEEDFSLIFEPGFTTKYSDSGSASTGIGLTHVKEIAGLLKGSINVNSSYNGTTFSVEIPIEEL